MFNTQIETIRLYVMRARMEGITEEYRKALYKEMDEARDNTVRENDALAMNEVKKLRAQLEALTPIGASHDAPDRADERNSDPQSPSIDASSDEWFDWYHVMRDEKNKRINLKMLANKIGLSYSYVKRLHADYEEEHKKTIPT